jgi:phage portal protein BeeE
MKPYMQALKKTDYPDWYLAYARSMGYEWPDYSKLDKQLGLYKRLSSLYTAVKVIATIGAPVKQQVKRRQGEEKIDIPNHALELLLDLPNPVNSGYAFMRNTLRYLAMGRAYWWLNATSPTAPPSEIWLIPSNKIGPVADGNMGIKHFLYDPGDGRLLQIPPENVIMLGEDDLLSPLKPFSAIETIANIAEGDLQMQKYNTQLFKGNGRLPGVMAFADMIQEDPWNDIKEQVRRDAAENNMLLLRGVGQGQLKWEQSSSTPRDMEFIEGRIANRNEIWNTFAQGLVSMLSENATEANARSGKATLIDLVVYPLLQYIGSELTGRLLPRYEAGLVCEPEDIRVTDRVLELQEIAEYSKTHTVDEVRERYWKDKPIEDKEIGVLLVEVAQKGAQAVAEEEKAGEGLPTETAKPTTDAEAQQKQAAQKADVKDPRPAMLELDKWERKAVKSIGTPFEWICYNVPNRMAEEIREELPKCANETAIKTIFDRARDELYVDMEPEVTTPAPAYKSEIVLLADALNNYAAKALIEIPQPAPAPAPNIYMSPITLTAQMPETGAPSVTFAPVIQPSEVINQNILEQQINVQPAENVNNIEVKPADVTVIPEPEKTKSVDIKVTKDSAGKITGAQGKIK